MTNSVHHARHVREQIRSSYQEALDHLSRGNPRKADAIFQRLKAQGKFVSDPRLPAQLRQEDRHFRQVFEESFMKILGYPSRPR